MPFLSVLRSRQQALQQWQAAYDLAPRVVINMDFDSKMKDGEIKSLSQQIMYCWSVIKQVWWVTGNVLMSTCSLTHIEWLVESPPQWLRMELEVDLALSTAPSLSMPTTPPRPNNQFNCLSVG